jgi:ribosomal protein S18 acetylase RimI-like enzyme
MQAVREFKLIDNGWVEAIFEAATAELRTVYHPRYVACDQQNATWDSCKLVFEKNSIVIGIVDFTLNDKEALIQGLAVDKAYRRCGVARALIDTCEERARAAGVGILKLSTIKETGNTAIFLRLGFSIYCEKTAERFISFDGRPVCQVELKKLI